MPLCFFFQIHNFLKYLTIYEHSDYKQFVNDWITSLPKSGHGQLRKLALQLNINSVVMSQVFRGNRELTLEQALEVTKYIGLTNKERDYFLLLVQKNRAGSHELKRVLESQLNDMRAKAKILKNRLKYQKFRKEDQMTFYSQWYYSAIRLGVSIPELNSTSAIADHLNLDRTLVAKVVDFLLERKLIVDKNGHLDMGPQVTHVAHDSPLVNRHHTNWRLKGLQAMEQTNDKNLFYTGPMALSKSAATKIHNLLITLIEQTTKEAKDSESETLSCLNIDWFKVGQAAN